ncbi:hypothetical protein CKA38_01155 [Ereboglobus luteus]|uniref:Transglutaminase-like domain-containing protein n=1 Tax=Ereboglobus luteus TaxID=1796921 RepID=A0A2U8DZM2_9BACT|nr:hypothetical protein CKA38_01155 [Ereboglobus luteus]
MSQRHLPALALSLLFVLSALQPFSPSAFSSPLPPLDTVTTERYPDADSVLVDEIIRTRYAADGSAFTRAETFVKILTEKGLRENRTHSMAYNIFYENTVVTLARIIHPDGTATPIDIAANTKEMTNRRSMAANIYDPNNKILTLALPGLKVGDTLHIVKETTTKRPRMKDTFCDWQSFESTSPIIRSTYEVRGPKDKPLAATAILDKNDDTLTAATRIEGDEIIHTWTARNVPQAFPEPSMPAFYICTQRLLVSTVATWEEVSKWYSSICEPHLASTPEIDAKVAELIAPPAGSTAPLTDDEKIRRVFRFVSQEIRYMGITLEKDSPGFEPHDVSLTFNNRYGVCRDKAALLVTMLRAAGFDAAPVLINAGPLVDPEVPKIYFNHAVTAVRLADGTDILMDSTDENTADLFPSYLANKSYLVARAEGDTLRVSPVAPAEENMLRAATRITIADDGSATGDITLDFSGINDNAYRGSFARAKPEDIRRWLETLLKNQIPGATLTAHEITPRNAMDTTRPLHAAISFSAPDYFTVAREKTILNTPWFGADFSIASRFLGNGTALAKRRFPLEIPYTCGLDETLTLNLPPRIGDTLALPDETRVELPAVTYEKTFTRNKNVITGKLAMRLRAPAWPRANPTRNSRTPSRTSSIPTASPPCSPPNPKRNSPPTSAPSTTNSPSRSTTRTTGRAAAPSASKCSPTRAKKITPKSSSTTTPSGKPSRSTTPPSRSRTAARAPSPPRKSTSWTPPGLPAPRATPPQKPWSSRSPASRKARQSTPKSPPPTKTNPGSPSRSPILVSIPSTPTHSPSTPPPA